MRTNKEEEDVIQAIADCGLAIEEEEEPWICELWICNRIMNGARKGEMREGTGVDRWGRFTEKIRQKRGSDGLEVIRSILNLKI